MVSASTTVDDDSLLKERLGLFARGLDGANRAAALDPLVDAVLDLDDDGLAKAATAHVRALME